MATVGPGKDYATIQAAMDDGNNNLDCYSGADLGAFSLNFGIHSFCNMNAVDRHNGVDVGHAGVAYFTGDSDLTDMPFVMEGMRVEGTIRWGPGFVFTDFQQRYRKNLFVSHTPFGSPMLLIQLPDDGSTQTVDIFNNVFYSATALTAPAVVQIYMPLILSGGSDSTLVSLAQNTIIQVAGSSAHGVFFGADGVEGLVPFEANVLNNISVGANTGGGFVDFKNTNAILLDVGTFAQNNLSSDTSATGVSPGGGAQTNKSAASTVVAPATNAKLKVGSAALNTGANIGFTTDDIRNVARPQMVIFDIGCFEMLASEVVVNAGGGGRFWAYRRR